MKNDYKIGDWVTVIASDSRFSKYNEAVGYTFRIRSNKSYYERLIKGEESCIDSTNKYHINYRLKDIRLATPEEIAAVTGKFILPKNWVIKVYKDRTPKEVFDWRNQNWIADGYISNSKWFDTDKKSCEVEISLDQFKQFVLKEEVKEVESSKEDLLKEAKLKYPVETKYIPFSSASTVKTATREPKIIYGKDAKLYGIEVGTGYVYLAEGNQWAEIIQDTLKVSDLVEGEIYFSNYQDGFVFKFNSIEPDNVFYVSNTFYSVSSWQFYKNVSIRAATHEEKAWLNACVSANKFIPKEEALKSEVINSDWSGFTPRNHLKSCFSKEVSAKSKRIEIYTEPQPVKEVEEIITLKIRKINKIKI